METLNELTAMNVRKVTRFRKNGIEELEQEVKRQESFGEKQEEKQHRDSSEKD
jgi:large subunit ribosomal protein L17